MVQPLRNNQENYILPEQRKNSEKEIKSTSLEWRAFKKNKLGMIGLIILILMLIVAIFANLIMPFDPFAQDVANRAVNPNSTHWLGTDPLGRDILSRIILGSRISLYVGFISVIISTLIGGFIGIVAAYKGGLIDDVLMRILDSIMMIPLLLFGLMVLVALGSNIVILILVIGIGLVPGVARIARGAALEIKEKEFIKAAISVGAGNPRVILRHILPNVIGPLLVIATLNMSSAIRIEASLSFLGVGVQPPAPTWGNMIQDGFQHITSTPGLVLFPGLALLIVSISFNIVGDAVRDAFDPHIKHRQK